MADTYELAEYEVKDGADVRTYQFEVGKQPKGAKRVGDVALSEPPAENPTVESTQEPDNKLDESARGQATEADVKAAEKANKASAPESDK